MSTVPPSASGATPSGRAVDPFFRSHSRAWRGCQYVYPVISRRSAGLSIGINLSLDRICNFNCVYCQVDRRSPARAFAIERAVASSRISCSE
jgi:sulfatase maturation enzyme AslB (radical SAM superfamily)